MFHSFTVRAAQLFRTRAKLNTWPGISPKCKNVEAIPESQRPIKPASQESTFKSIGAMLALEHFGLMNPEDPQFRNIGACWISTLIPRGTVLFSHVKRAYYLSLGGQSFAAVGWRLVEVETDVFQLAPPSLLSLEEARDRICIICLHDLDDVDSFSETHSAVPVHVRESLRNVMCLCFCRAICNSAVVNCFAGLPICFWRF